MYISKALTSILLSTALTSFVASAPLDSEALPAASAPSLDRRDNDAFGIKATKAEWDHYASFCGSSKGKRDLEKRVPAQPFQGPGNRVDQGGKGGADLVGIPIGLWTWNLKPCIGVVVIGKTKDGKKDARFLAHIQAKSDAIETEWDAFEKDVKNAKLDKDTTAGFISAPDLTTQLPTGMGGFNDSDKKLAKEVLDKIKGKMDDLVKGDPKVVTRFMKPVEDDENNVNGIMYVTGDQKVSIAGQAQN